MSFAPLVSPVRYVLLIALGLSLTSGMATDGREVCQGFLSRLAGHAGVYTPNCCHRNIGQAIGVLSKWDPHFDMARAQVLILRPRAGTLIYPLNKERVWTWGWKFHVVLEYEGQVVDLDHPGEPLSVEDYFSSLYLDAAKPNAFRRFMDRMMGNGTPWDNADMTVETVDALEYRKNRQYQRLEQAPPQATLIPVSQFGGQVPD